MLTCTRETRLELSMSWTKLNAVREEVNGSKEQYKVCKAMLTRSKMNLYV